MQDVKWQMSDVHWDNLSLVDATTVANDALDDAPVPVPGFTTRHGDKKVISIVHSQSGRCRTIESLIGA